MTEELKMKPCPFCGGTKISMPGRYGEPAMCQSCYSIGEGNWNHRPIEDALNQHIAELEAQVWKHMQAAEKCHVLEGEIASLNGRLHDVIEENHDIQAELATLREAQRWIPCTERLPEIGFRGDVFMKNHYQVKATYFENWWINDAGAKIDPANVTHYRSLPPAPEVE